MGQSPKGIKLGKGLPYRVRIAGLGSLLIGFLCAVKRRVTPIYAYTKMKQIRLYINQIALVLGHENTLQIRAIYLEAYDCYREIALPCAYLEQKYGTILDSYRASDPGMPAHLIQALPPFRRKLNKTTIARLVEMRKRVPYGIIIPGNIEQQKAL